jgi:hypothetical protein
MKFLAALATLTAFVAAHNGAHDAQGNHLDAQGNIIQYANTNQQTNGYTNSYNEVHGHNPNEPCNHPIQGQQGYNKKY